MEVVAMEYRNIDNDYVLHKTVKRYYEQNDFNKQQLIWILTNDGYSEDEVDKAVYDYYLVYVRTNKITSYIMWAICVWLIIYLCYCFLCRFNNIN